MSADVDLSALTRTSAEIDPPRRGWLRIVLPLAVLAVFAFLLRGALAELFVTRSEVTVVQPLRIEGAARDDGGGTPAADEPGAAPADDAPARVVVQAAGWVEPDPFPFLAPALAGGVVVEVLVQESDEVDAGDPVATLVDDDARIARDRAAADLAHAEAQLETARVRARIASERFDAALEVTEAADVADALRAGREAEAELRRAAIAEGEAEVALADSEVVVQRELDAAGASGPRQVEIAEAELVAARATLARLEAEAAVAAARSAEAGAVQERAAAERELRFADRLERDVSAGEVARLEASVERARAALAAAELALERTTVHAPADGVVLERLATAGADLAVGAPVCSLWDPRSLRIRVDVPQGDVERVFVGQRAEILSESRDGRPYRGEVIRIVQLADIQKVTLEAQVRVTDPDGLLRPDMLTQVKFFASAEASSRPGSGSRPGSMRIALDRRLVTDGTVWVYDPVDEVARRREVEVGPPFGEEGRLVEIYAGLDLTDKVVDAGREALRDTEAGDRGVPVEVVDAARTTRNTNRTGGQR